VTVDEALDHVAKNMALASQETFDNLWEHYPELTVEDLTEAQKRAWIHALAMPGNIARFNDAYEMLSARAVAK